MTTRTVRVKPKPITDSIETLATQVYKRGQTLSIDKDSEGTTWTITIHSPNLLPPVHYYSGYKGQTLRSLANAVNGKHRYGT
jgi:hypothetical protein